MSPTMSDEKMTAEAAKMLDEIKPGWHTNINFNKLDMGSGERCIAGQNNLDWSLMRYILRERGVPDCGVASPFVHTRFVPMWRAEVNARSDVGKVRLRDKAMLALSACFR